MSYELDLTDTQVFTALRAFIIDTLGDKVTAVIRIPTNRVPLPSTFPYISMQPIGKKPLAWGESILTDPALPAQSSHTTVPQLYRIQVNINGDASGNLVHILAATFLSGIAFDYFAANAQAGIRPVTVDDPIQDPLINQEEQFEVRWHMDVYLQYNPTIQIATQSASAAEVNLINVEASYH